MSKIQTFADCCAGIGGFALACQNEGLQSTFVCEIDNKARQTYRANFYSHIIYSDITQVFPSSMPNFDLLCSGFPCQPFSRIGQKAGFEDPRGNIFIALANIIKEKNPKAFLLENVTGLLSHDNGNTFRTIKNIVEDELGYAFHYKVLKACDYGVPQLRPRVFMVGLRDYKAGTTFTFPEPTPLTVTMSDILGGECPRKIGLTLRVGGRSSGIDDRRNWDSYRVDGEVRTLTVAQMKAMQGFPESFVFPVSDNEAKKQLGNSVAINVVQAVLKEILKVTNT